MVISFKVKCKCKNKFVPTQFQRYYKCPKCGRTVDTGSVNLDVFSVGVVSGY